MSTRLPIALAALALVAACGQSRQPAEPVPFDVVDVAPAPPEPVGPPARELLQGTFEHTASAGGVEWTTGVSFDGALLIRLRDGLPTGVDRCTVRDEEAAEVVLDCEDDAGTRTRRPWRVDADGATDLVTNVRYRRAGPPLPSAEEGSGS